MICSPCVHSACIMSRNISSSSCTAMTQCACSNTLCQNMTCNACRHCSAECQRGFKDCFTECTIGQRMTRVTYSSGGSSSPSSNSSPSSPPPSSLSSSSSVYYNKVSIKLSISKWGYKARSSSQLCFEQLTQPEVIPQCCTFFSPTPSQECADQVALGLSLDLHQCEHNSHSHSFECSVRFRVVGLLVYVHIDVHIHAKVSKFNILTQP